MARRGISQPDPDHAKLTLPTRSFTWEATVSLGADNMFNHRGPLLFSNSNARSSDFPYYGDFDIGRFIYMKYQQRF